MPNTRINASSYMPVSAQIPNNKTRFRTTSPFESVKANAGQPTALAPEKSQVASVIAPPTKPTANNATDTNRILFRCCTLSVQRLKALGSANPTPARATNASTVSCMNACGKSPGDITLITVNDANSTAMNAATVFPFRTSAHHPPRYQKSLRTKTLRSRRLITCDQNLMQPAAHRLQPKPYQPSGYCLRTKTSRSHQTIARNQNLALPSAHDWRPKLCAVADSSPAANLAKPSTRYPQSKRPAPFGTGLWVSHSVYSNAALTTRAPSSELPRGGG